MMSESELKVEKQVFLEGHGAIKAIGDAMIESNCANITISYETYLHLAKGYIAAVDLIEDLTKELMELSELSIKARESLKES